MKLRLGLIGKDISHSRSEQVYQDLLQNTEVELEYQLLDCQSEGDIPSIATLKEKFNGISITAPYKGYFIDKVKIIPSAQQVDIDSINCLRWNDIGEVEATSTDLPALDSIINQITSSKNCDCFVILGDGAVATMIKRLLEIRQTTFYQFSRKILNDQGRLERGDFFHPANLDRFNRIVWINCCLRGFTYRGPISADDIFWDQNYDSYTQLNYIKSTGAEYIDGMEMLRRQAKYAIKFWNFL